MLRPQESLKVYHQWNYRLILQVKRALRAIVYLFNLHTLLLLAASCLAVWVSARSGWSFAMEFSIISTGTIFPLTFALSQAYTRREHATFLIADLKASVVGLYWMHRDWDQTNNFPSSIGNDFLPQAVRAKAILVELLLSVRSYLMSTSSFESMAEARLSAHKHEFLAIFDHDVKLVQKARTFRHNVAGLLQGDEGQRHLADIYKWLSRISVMNERLMLATGYSKGGEGGFSRTSQYLRYLIASVESLRVIKEYRTPSMMRHASGVLLHVFAIILAPYFVHFCSDEAEGGCAAAYFTASSYVMIVMLLYHVQQDLENCFSVSGLDDALFLVAEEVDALTDATVLHSTASSRTYVHGATPLGGSPRGGPLHAPPSDPARSFDLPPTLSTDKTSLKPILEGVAHMSENCEDTAAPAKARTVTVEAHTGGPDNSGVASLAAIFTRANSRRITTSPSSSWRRVASARAFSPDSLPSPAGDLNTPLPSPGSLASPPAAVTEALENSNVANGAPQMQSPVPSMIARRAQQIQMSIPLSALGNCTEDSPFAKGRKERPLDVQLSGV